MLDVEFFVGSYTEHGDISKKVFGKYRDDAPGFDLDRSTDITYMERCVRIGWFTFYSFPPYFSR